jgi:hypothetical protein
MRILGAEGAELLRSGLEHQVFHRRRCNIFMHGSSRREHSSTFARIVLGGELPEQATRVRIGRVPDRRSLQLSP